MKQPIRPDTLKTLRERRGLSQAKLEARCEEMRQKVGVATIKRIETWAETETYMATSTVAERLAKVLGVKVSDLAKEPKPDDVDRTKELRKLGMRQLRVAVQEKTFLGFRIVEHLYGIPVRTQIEMAPLCMALLAEGSLAWRKKRLAEIDEKAAQLMSLGGGNFSFAQAVYRTQEAALDEEESIRKRDVFGKHVAEDTYSLGYDPNTNNPLADYLRALAGDLGTKNLELDPEFFEIGSFGFPEYRIGAGLLNELTAGNDDAEYALACGHVRIPDIPEELLGADKSERRVEWLISRIPDEEIADRRSRHAELSSLLGEFDLDIPASSTSANEAKENNDA
jgi:transcriptional regulator with XRE-family HTH domain